ncbi:hypothetical protein B0H14DRAFT_2563872 [Mycena olivaceomarginata]|nr:hypothetical protein B0H14DRAFT_2563872 [Mycena olivaceomarginata]
MYMPNFDWLAASVALMLLSLEHLLWLPEGKEGHDLPIDGTGLLYVIWLYRNHPELEVHLKQVEYPTEDNAGMVRVTLLRSPETLTKIIWLTNLGYGGVPTSIHPSQETTCPPKQLATRVLDTVRTFSQSVHTVLEAFSRTGRIGFPSLNLA